MHCHLISIYKDFLETSADAGHCFSLESTVEVQGKGTTAIKDLQIGDMVLSDEHGSYTKFYSFGKWDDVAPILFLRIFTESTTKPLEVTGNHMIYKAFEKMSVPARFIKVGDIVKTADGPAKVTFIKEATRQGLANPLTLSSTMVVDGIVTSNWVEIPAHDGVSFDYGWFTVGNRKIVHLETISRIIYSPHRLICGHLMTCPQNKQGGTFRPAFSSFRKTVQNKALEVKSPAFSCFCVLALVTIGFFFYVIELLVQNVAVVALVSAGSWFYLKRLSNKIKVKTA